MTMPAVRHRLVRFCFPLLCGVVLALSLSPGNVQAQTGSESTGKRASGADAASGELSADAIKARIAVVGARTDISEQERDLVLKQLNTAATRLQAAGAARKAAEAYAATLKSAPKTIAALNAESASSSSEVVPHVADHDPVQMQLKLASLQTEAVTLRSKQRDLEESLRSMANRPAEARGELADLHRQLDEPPPALPSRASSLLIEASHLQEEATRQELSARIDKIEQELLSLPTRESIATARRDLTARRIARVDTAIATLNTRIHVQRKHEAEKQAAQAEAFAQKLNGQPAVLQDYADQNARVRVSLKHLNGQLDQTRDARQTLQTRRSEVAEARNNAEQILAIGRISDESGRLLRNLQGELMSSHVLQARIATRKDAIVEARVKQLQTRQALRELQSEETVAKHYLDDHAVADPDAHLSLMKSLVERRRAALSDLDEAQGQLVSVLSEANALDVELMQDTAKLRSLLDERLLWLPSAEPLGIAWLQQLGTGVAWLVTPSHWAGAPSALVTTLRDYWLTMLVLLTVVTALFASRRRMAGSLDGLARDIGTRRDRFRSTLQACAATLMLALAWPLVIGIVGWMLRISASPNGFVNALGHGVLGVAIVWFMLGIFTDMCRARGVFIAHFGWSAKGSKRLARALHMLLLVIVPAAFLSAMAIASGRPDLVNGIGRLGFLIGSLAIALFLHRVFRPHGGALTGGRGRGGWGVRTRKVWSNVLVAIPLLLAVLSAVGYYVTARELQGRLFTSGWVVLVVVIVFFVAMRGVLVATRRAAWRQADKRHAQALAEAARDAEGGEGSEALNLQNQEPQIDAVSVSQQTRSLLRAVSGAVLVFLLWGIWSGLVPALNVFNDIALWSYVVGSDAGGKVAVVTLGNLLSSLVIAVLTVIAARNLPGFLEVTLLQRLRIDHGIRYAVSSIGRYLILGIGLMAAFNHIGADWSQLKWLVAALGVGLGFGLQEIVANFISGIIILFERPVRVGDLVSIGPTLGTVSRIRIRAITITDFDNFEVMVPNKAFITETVQNWSLTNEVTRLLIVVRIAYGSDVEKAQQIIHDIATGNPHVLESPEPSAYFLRYGEHALEFELRAYVGTIDERLSTQHALHVAIDHAFKEAGIEILFPQRDMHVRSLDTGKGER